MPGHMDKGTKNYRDMMKRMEKMDPNSVVREGEINLEIKKSILKKAALYEWQKRKNNKKYKGPTFEGKGKEGGGLF